MLTRIQRIGLAGLTCAAALAVLPLKQAAADDARAQVAPAIYRPSDSGQAVHTQPVGLLGGLFGGYCGPGWGGWGWGGGYGPYYGYGYRPYYYGGYYRPYGGYYYGGVPYRSFYGYPGYGYGYYGYPGYGYSGIGLGIW